MLKSGAFSLWGTLAVRAALGGANPHSGTRLPTLSVRWVSRRGGALRVFLSPGAIISPSYRLLFFPQYKKTNQPTHRPTTFPTHPPTIQQHCVVLSQQPQLRLPPSSHAGRWVRDGAAPSLCTSRCLLGSTRARASAVTVLKSPRAFTATPRTGAAQQDLGKTA